LGRDALGIRGGIKAPEALDLGKGVGIVWLAGEVGSIAGESVNVMATDYVTSHELDKDLAWIETGLVVENNRNRERVHGLLSQSGCGSTGDQQKRGNQAKSWIFIHHKMANGASDGLFWKVRGMKHFFLACEQDFLMKHSQAHDKKRRIKQPLARSLRNELRKPQGEDGVGSAEVPERVRALESLTRRKSVRTRARRHAPLACRPHTLSLHIRVCNFRHDKSRSMKLEAKNETCLSTGSVFANLA
jgi:hypothetical protein